MRLMGVRGDLDLLKALGGMVMSAALPAINRIMNQRSPQLPYHYLASTGSGRPRWEPRRVRGRKGNRRRPHLMRSSPYSFPGVINARVKHVPCGRSPCARVLCQ